MKMKAGVLTVCGAPRPFARSKPIHVLEVDLDPPGEGEVLVKVGGGGLCHSDLSLLNGDRPRPVPIVLFDSSYWKGLLHLDTMTEAGFIRPEDLKLFSYADTPEQAYDCIVHGAGEGWNPPGNGSVQT